MRRSLLTVCAALVLVAGTARPADARMEELIDWLMELKGPGPYKGMRVEWEYMCIGQLPQVQLQTSTVTDRGEEEVHLHPAHKCYYLRKAARQYHFGVTGSVMNKADSKYPTAEPLSLLDPEVTAFPFGATFDMTVPVLDPESNALARMLEVGGTVSGVRYSGQRFPAFWLQKYELRLTFRPGGHTTGRSKWDPVLFRVMGQWMGSVTPQQFGGIPGDESGKHFKVYATAGIDVERLFIR